MAGSERPEGGLLSAYRDQEKYAWRTFHRARFAAVCVLQVLAALLGPWVPAPVRGDTLEGYLVPVVPWIALLVLMFVAIALWQDDTTAAYAGGILGLLIFPFYFLGTVLSLCSLLLLRTVETVGPRPRVRERRNGP